VLCEFRIKSEGSGCVLRRRDGSQDTVRGWCQTESYIVVNETGWKAGVG
jgi:hypothetical protein